MTVLDAGNAGMWWLVPGEGGSWEDRISIAADDRWDGMA